MGLVYNKSIKVKRKVLKMKKFFVKYDAGAGAIYNEYVYAESMESFIEKHNQQKDAWPIIDIWESKKC